MLYVERRREFQTSQSLQSSLPSELNDLDQIVVGDIGLDWNS